VIEGAKTTTSGAADSSLPRCCGVVLGVSRGTCPADANGCKGSDKGSDTRKRRAFGLNLSTNWANGRGLVPHTGCWSDCLMLPTTLSCDFHETHGRHGSHRIRVQIRVQSATPRSGRTRTAQGPSQPRPYQWRTIGMARMVPVGRATNGCSILSIVAHEFRCGEDRPGQRGPGGDSRQFRRARA
jgi:hypothetical protein